MGVVKADEKHAFPRNFKLRKEIRVEKQGLCENCNRPVREGKTRCEICASMCTRFSKKWRQARIDAGQCIDCGSPHVGPPLRCPECGTRHSQAQKRKVC